MKRPESFSLLKRVPSVVVASADSVSCAKSNAPYNNRRWQAIRRIQLDREPLCRTCKAQSITTIATQVDHIKRLRWGGTHDADNLQSLCASCHSKKTQREGKGSNLKP